MTVDEVRELYQRIGREQPDLWKKDPQAAILADSVGRIDLLEKRFAKFLQGARQLALEVKALREGGEPRAEASPPTPTDNDASPASTPVQQPNAAEQAALEAEMDAAIAAGSPALGENVPRPPVGRPAPSQKGGGNGRPRPVAPATPAAPAASPRTVRIPSTE